MSEVYKVGDLVQFEDATWNGLVAEARLDTIDDYPEAGFLATITKIHQKPSSCRWLDVGESDYYVRVTEIKFHIRETYPTHLDSELVCVYGVPVYKDQLDAEYDEPEVTVEVGHDGLTDDERAAQMAKLRPSKHVDPKAAYGATKPSVAIIPGILEVVAALAAEDGAKKYGAYNYREGHPVEVMTYANAAKRHLQAFIDREDFTSDTGVPNLGGVIMCVGIILDIMSTGVAVDNRPPRGRASEVQDAGKKWKQAVAAGEDPVEAAKRILGPAMGVKS